MECNLSELIDRGMWAYHPLSDAPFFQERMVFALTFTDLPKAKPTRRGSGGCKHADYLQIPPLLARAPKANQKTYLLPKAAAPLVDDSVNRSDPSRSQRQYEARLVKGVTRDQTQTILWRSASAKGGEDVVVE